MDNCIKFDISYLKMFFGLNYYRLIEVDKVSLKMVVLINLLNNDDYFVFLRFVIKWLMLFK